MSLKRKKDEKEEKDRDYDPGQESFEETSEEEEETEETSDSEDDVIHDAQPLLKELTKPSKKKVSVQNSSPPLKKKAHELKRKFNVTENNDETEEKKLKKTRADLGSGSGKKKSDSLFNDEIVDVNLYNEAPQNIKEKTVMLNQGLLMKCHVVDAAEMKNNYNTDFSALTFVKKIKDGKSFRFSVPLNLGPTIQNAIHVFVTANPQFFAGSKTYELVEVNNQKRH